MRLALFLFYNNINQQSILMAKQDKSKQGRQEAEQVLFEDKDVKITNRYVYIKWYFFPWAGTKKIPISSIKNVEKRELGWAKARLWGMDATQWGYWLAGDRKRFSRTHFIGIHLDSSVKPSFTTQSIDEVYRLLRELVLRYQEGGRVSRSEKSENAEGELEEMRLKDE